ncbi:MAG: uroporphyrinogen decarboxylase family protein [Agathobacter sp.]
MTSMERMVKALNHEQPDRTPVYQVIAGAARRLVDASYPEWSVNADICAESFIKAQKEFNMDCVVTLIDLSVECAAWGQELIFPENEAAHPNYKNCVIQDIDEYEKIKKVDYRTCDRMMMHIDVCKKVVEASKGEYPVIAFVFGPLGTLSMLRNQSEMYMDIFDDPDVVRDAAFEIKETLKEYCTALMETGVQGIMFDTLFSSGSIMRKEMWDDMEGELVEDLANHVHNLGGMVMIHNCGDKIYLDAQIKRMKPEGISLLFPADDCADFAETKAKYGQQTTLIGCVEPTKVVFGEEEAFVNECKEHIDVMGKDGGYILALGCEYPANASFERAYKMYEIAETYNPYA